MAFPAGLLRTLATDLVNRVTQLNNLWDNIDAGFSSVYVTRAGANAVPSPSQGVEWFNGNGAIQVYNGSSWQAPDTTEVWGSWVNLTLQSPFVSSGATPRIRISNFKNVEVEGGISYNNTNWPASPDYQLVNTGQFSTTYLPEMTSVFDLGTSIPGSNFNRAQAYITVSGGSPSYFQLYVCFAGTRAANNSAQLYNIRYKAA